MMWKILKKYLDRFLETLVAVSMLVLTIDVTWQVITRFILKHPSNWTEELATYLMMWVGLLGAAVALNRRAHLGIDYFVGRFPPKAKLLTEGVVNFLVFLFSIFVMGFGGLRLVLITFQLGQLTPALKLPMGYIYLAIPVAGVFLAIYSLEFCLEAAAGLGRLSGRKNAPVASAEKLQES